MTFSLHPPHPNPLPRRGEGNWRDLATGGIPRSHHYVRSRPLRCAKGAVV